MNDIANENFRNDPSFALGRMSERQDIVEDIMTYPQRKAVKRAIDLLSTLAEGGEYSSEDVAKTLRALCKFFPKTERVGWDSYIGDVQ